MNLVLKQVSHEEGSTGSVEGLAKSEQEWAELGAIAQYITGVRDSLANYKAEDLPDFAKQETANSSPSESLWEIALKKKKQYVTERAAKRRANRGDIIREQLADFNQLQQMAQQRMQQVERLESLAQRQPARIKNLIETAISTPNTCLDFDLLYDKIVSGVDPTQTGLAEFVNAD